MCFLEYSKAEPFTSTCGPQTHRQSGDTSCSPPQPPEDTHHAEERALQVEASEQYLTVIESFFLLGIADAIAVLSSKSLTCSWLTC